MKIVSSESRARALTLMEVLIVVAALMILAAVLLPTLMRLTPSGSKRIQCVNNLKLVGLAYRIWEADNGNKYPMCVPETNGGTMEFFSGANEWRHFQIMSNEISTKILFCPAETDQNRSPEESFRFLCNSNLSYFVGLVTNDVNAELILSGDHNITNGTAVRNGLLQLTAASPAGWTAEMHNTVGNIGLADGSVQQVSISGLQMLVTNTGVATNWIQMPVLGP